MGDKVESATAKPALPTDHPESENMNRMLSNLWNMMVRENLIDEKLSDEAGPASDHESRGKLNIAQVAERVMLRQKCEVEQAHDTLRELASYVGNGGFNAPKVHVAIFDAKIRDGIDFIIRVETKRREAAEAKLAAANEEIKRLSKACRAQNAEIEQTLGQALGFPWYKDDQENFPGATGVDGVCTGELIAEDLAHLAVKRLTAQAEQIAVLEAGLTKVAAFAKAWRVRAGLTGKEPFPTLTGSVIEIASAAMSKKEGK